MCKIPGPWEGDETFARHALGTLPHHSAAVGSEAPTLEPDLPVLPLTSCVILGK